MGVGAYHWAMGIVGLWVAWVVLTFFATLTGTVWGLQNYIWDTLENNTDLVIPQPIKDAMNNVYSWFTSFWNFLALAVFTGFVIYILVNSMRRDVEEYYFP